MGKYSQAQDNVFSVLDAMKAEVRAYPSGFDGDKGDPPYIRVTIVPSGPPLNASSISGVLLVEIFTAWGEGPARSSELADTLDRYLQRKTVGTTQFFSSSMDRQEQDKDNATLARVIYSLPFAHFGVNE